MRSATPLPTNSIEALQRIPQQELYRLIVDGRLHKDEQGWFGYATRQKNCLPAAFNALQYALTNLDDKTISSDLVKEIHARTIEDVPDLKNIVPRQFRQHPAGYPLAWEFNINQAGLNELYGSIIYHSNDNCIVATNDYHEFIGHPQSQAEWDARMNSFKQDQSQDELWEALHNKKYVFYRAYAPEHINTQINACCEYFNKAIQTAVSSEEKLKLIAFTVRAINQIHPFQDANIRAGLILLQRLLIQNGFLPTMMYDPNHFDALDLDSLVEEIKKGMQVTLDSILKPEKPLFNFLTRKVEPEALMEIDEYAPPEAWYRNDKISSDNEEIGNYYQAEKSLHQSRQSLAPNALTLDLTSFAIKKPKLETDSVTNNLVRLSVYANSTKRTRLVTEDLAQEEACSTACKKSCTIL